MYVQDAAHTFSDIQGTLHTSIAVEANRHQRLLAAAFMAGNECAASWSLVTATVHEAVRARRDLPLLEIMFVSVPCCEDPFLTA